MKCCLRWRTFTTHKHTHTLTLTGSKPFSVSACLYSALVSKCRSYSDPWDLQGSCTAPDHVVFSCIYVFSVVRCLWFKYVSCCVPYGQNNPSQGTELQAGNRAFRLACRRTQIHTRTPLCAHNQTTKLKQRAPHTFSHYCRHTETKHFQPLLHSCTHTNTLLHIHNHKLTH